MLHLIGNLKPRQRELLISALLVLAVVVLATVVVLVVGPQICEPCNQMK